MDLKWIRGEPPTDGREYLVCLKEDGLDLARCLALVSYDGTARLESGWRESWSDYILHREVLCWMEVPMPE